MRFLLTRILLCAAVVWTTREGFVRAADSTPAVKAPRQVYLLMGQSNMAGRGKLDAGKQTPDPRVVVFNKENQWAVATDPLHWDKPKIAGVGPGLSFGIAMANAQPGVSIGLVPCAFGGSPLSRWQKGGDLYSEALDRAKAAASGSQLAGILWHQGESDAKQEESATYLQRFTEMIRDFRSDLGLPNLPVVVGELGEFHVRNVGEPSAAVNQALRDAAIELPNCACVSSAELLDGGDQLHFDAASQREFGKRYAEAMLKLKR
jgi:hypothetical protein